MADPSQTQDSDYRPIEERRSFRQVVGGFAYDTATASLLHREERIYSAKTFSGSALYINVYGKLFIHHYHQWDRFNAVVPVTTAQAIEWLEKRNPGMIEGFFGFLPEEGQGEAYTPIE